MSPWRVAARSALGVRTTGVSSVGRGALFVAILVVIAGIVGMHALTISHHPSTAVGVMISGDEAHDARGHDPHSDQLMYETTGGVATLHVITVVCAPGCSDVFVHTGASCVVALTLVFILGRPRRRGLTLVLAVCSRLFARLTAMWESRPSPRPPPLAALCILRI